MTTVYEKGVGGGGVGLWYLVKENPSLHYGSIHFPSPV